jgi:hypothetical protein
MNAVRFQALNGAPPPADDYVVVTTEGGPAASMKPGRESSVRSSGITTLSARWPSNGLGQSPPQTRPQ